MADFLKRSGHEVSLLSPSDIRSSTEVLIALQPALILALEPELGAIRAQLQDTDLHADLLPVLYKPGSEELASVRADYGLALAVPNRLSQLLAIVDQALDKSTRVAS